MWFREVKWLRRSFNNSAMIWFPTIHLAQKLVPELSAEASAESTVKHLLWTLLLYWSQRSSILEQCGIKACSCTFANTSDVCYKATWKCAWSFVKPWLNSRYLNLWCCTGPEPSRQASQTGQIYVVYLAQSVNEHVSVGKWGLIDIPISFSNSIK
jgi:hypothetical protein